MTTGRIIAIGPREQDFEFTNNFFSETLTLYGSNKNGNTSFCHANKVRINHNIHSTAQKEFIINEALKRIEINPNVKFMSYDPNLAFECGPEILKHTVCLNKKDLMDKLNNKIIFRKWAKSFSNVFPSRLISGENCSFSQLSEYFGYNNSFVIQSDISSGGEGTKIINKFNSNDILKTLNQETEYLVSPYIKNNIPVNIHVIIYSDYIMLTPISVQIITKLANKLLYRGADFIAVEQIKKSTLDKFKNDVISICKTLQREGYRGVAGIDGMLVNDTSYIMEVNNRFQGSTPLLNRALHEHGLPSMDELNFEAFSLDKPSVDISHLKISYSCYTYISDINGNKPLGHMTNFERDKDVVAVRDDGLTYSWDIMPFASLERITFNTNISGLTEDNYVLIHPNIIEVNPEWFNEITIKKNPLYIKIALLNQGIFIPPQTEDFLIKKGGIREGVYNSIDIAIGNLIINSATRVKFARLSPFSLEVINGELILKYCKRKVVKVSVQPADKLQNIQLTSDTKVSNVCLLATDRLRIQHSRNCYFKRNGEGCRFCEVENHEYTFDKCDLYKVINMYMSSNCSFRHFLIGGRSDSPSLEQKEILELCKYIRSISNAPIYVMCVPPKDFKIFNEWKKAGATEISFNIEIWDPIIAKKWMPGKGSIPRSYYLKALEEATNIWGKTGNVRSAFVVGLEPYESLLEGIEAVCKIGVAPILSVFRPIPNTYGNLIIPPSNEQLLYIYNQAVKICKKYNLELGPSCEACQNNTLSMPQEYIIKGLV